jgi:hypothetical protein
MRSPNHRARQALLVIPAAIAVMPGCAIHSFDQRTGTEHIWGFGHMRMKVAPPNEGLQAVLRGTDVLGLGLGLGDRESYLILGWHRSERLDILEQDAAIRLERPTSDFVTFRVGSKFPQELFETKAPAVAGSEEQGSSP